MAPFFSTEAALWACALLCQQRPREERSWMLISCESLKYAKCIKGSGTDSNVCGEWFPHSQDSSSVSYNAAPF